MSTTIGIGYSALEGFDLYAELSPIAEKFGYGLLRGIKYAESDVEVGLSVAQNNQCWDDILFLQSPKIGEVGLAFGIQEELVALETKNIRPVFFSFLEELSKLDIARCKKIGFFFAGEWGAHDSVRYSYGDIDRLILLLSLPGHWGGRFLIPQTGHLQDSDDIPFLYNLNP